MGAPSRLWLDAKENTGFKVDSTIPTLFQDQESGLTFAGNVTPFFGIGSYLYLGAGIGGRIGDGSTGAKGLGFMGPGVRFNGITRPLIHKGLSQIPWLKNNAPFIDAAADAVSVGYLLGHDFNHPTKDQVIVNRYGPSIGLEIAFGGPKKEEVGAMSFGDDAGSWSLR